MNEKRDKKRLEEFGVNLKALREKLNLSQDDIAARCDVTKGNLSNIENGKKDFTFTTLHEIAKGLGLTVSKLTDYKNE